ncbi:hypothetical protein KDK95_30270 [Actinospica sp. MGRD01-02]|uniref:Uncharacterized protein n=1 Tax=Actinospica acidithermotolerans TaxID=2828514 RepID=A0A941EFQ8_9ACTN|nr:hypothetical protein [Actinospica acidithermotolerans]MBR7830626.1 hypothetical protein [Actinospica acidithermotolerans]
MSSLIPPDDLPVTLSWITASIERHEHTVPFGTLRTYLDHAERSGRPGHPDYARDFDLLKDTWLAVHEREILDYRHIRRITGHDLAPLARLGVFTVSVDDADPGEEKECPHTYVLHAPDLESACTLATAHHMGHFSADYPPGSTPPSILESRWWTFPGAPSWPADLSGRTWTDLRGESELLERAYRTGAGR